MIVLMRESRLLPGSSTNARGETMSCRGRFFAFSAARLGGCVAPVIVGILGRRRSVVARGTWGSNGCGTAAGGTALGGAAGGGKEGCVRPQSPLPTTALTPHSFPRTNPKEASAPDPATAKTRTLAVRLSQGLRSHSTGLLSELLGVVDRTTSPRTMSWSWT